MSPMAVERVSSVAPIQCRLLKRLVRSALRGCRADHGLQVCSRHPLPPALASRLVGLCLRSPRAWRELRRQQSHSRGGLRQPVAPGVAPLPHGGQGRGSQPRAPPFPPRRFRPSVAHPAWPQAPHRGWAWSTQHASSLRRAHPTDRGARARALGVQRLAGRVGALPRARPPPTPRPPSPSRAGPCAGHSPKTRGPGPVPGGARHAAASQAHHGSAGSPLRRGPGAPTRCPGPRAPRPGPAGTERPDPLLGPPAWRAARAPAVSRCGEPAHAAWRQGRGPCGGDAPDAAWPQSAGPRDVRQPAGPSPPSDPAARPERHDGPLGWMAERGADPLRGRGERPMAGPPVAPRGPAERRGRTRRRALADHAGRALPPRPRCPGLAARALAPAARAPRAQPLGGAGGQAGAPGRSARAPLQAVEGVPLALGALLGTGQERGRCEGKPGTGRPARLGAGPVAMVTARSRERGAAAADPGTERLGRALLTDVGRHEGQGTTPAQAQHSVQGRGSCRMAVYARPVQRTR